jgi:hypothetical protein
MRANANAFNSEYLIRQPRGLSKLKAFSNQLLERLVADGSLPADVLREINPSSQFPVSKHHLAIARAFELHLSSSGEFSYTLDLKRQDKAIDPVEDFLLNTKSGHCQRFATALVLLLRCQGIRCQMVVGYRGCESRGDGWYDVREDQAHAWVEVLLDAPEEPRPFGAAWEHAQSGDAVAPTAVLGGGLAAERLTHFNNWQPMRWVTLDPTPSTPGGDEGGAASLLEQARQKWDAILKAVLLAYNRESRDQAAEALQTWLTDDGGWICLVGGAGLLILLAVWRRRARRKASLYAAFPLEVRRLAIALASVGLTWRPGQTAREFAVEAGRLLGDNPARAGVADTPHRVIDAYYATRFGERPINEQEWHDVDVELRRLESALR